MVRVIAAESKITTNTTDIDNVEADVYSLSRRTD